MIGGAQATIVTDTVSPLPDHDFENVVTIVNDDFVLDIATDKVRSTNSKQAFMHLSAAKARGECPIFDFGNHKECRHCGLAEGPSTVKMKHCKRCRKVSYCGKECQDANWGDHKLECQSLQRASWMNVRSTEC